ncbi:hypothetical protein C8R46DRAFT_241650 [Mycena filopes]|nr:hypothetical protein C8R46DRAFT_241650 [Mycena filopes]
MMENGWTRHDAKSFNTDITLIVNTCGRRESWLSQANSIFGSLHIGSNLENYALVDQVYFTLRINRTVDLDCPNGYLFLCPAHHFQVNTSSLKWPDSPAYWSLDPLGHECLTVEEALRLGFPSLWRTTEVYSYSWDTSIYAGLRRFHQAKGFDPDSQDVAQHLGYPLYRLSKDVNPPFAHVAEYERESWGNFKDDEDWDDEGMEEEAKSASGAEEQSHCDSLSVEFSNHGGQQSSESLLVVIGGPGIQSPEYASSQPMLHHAEEDIPVTLKILANIQLTLILFLATCWMYDNVQ